MEANNMDTTADNNIYGNILQSLQSQIEQFIDGAVERVKHEMKDAMLTMMDSKLRQLKTDLNQVDSVEALQEYIASNIATKMSTTTIAASGEGERPKQQPQPPPPKYEPITLDELNQCIDYLHSQTINSFDREELKKFIPLFGVAPPKVEETKPPEVVTAVAATAVAPALSGAEAVLAGVSAAVSVAVPRTRRNANKASEKTTTTAKTLKTSTASQPLAELNGQVPTSHRHFTRKQAAKGSSTSNMVKRPKKVAAERKETVMKDENENICDKIDQQQQPPPPKKTLSRIFKDKLFGVAAGNEGNGKTTTTTTAAEKNDDARDDTKSFATVDRVAKARVPTVHVSHHPDPDDFDSDALASDDDDQPRPFALTRNMWERRSLKGGTKFPVLK